MNQLHELTDRLAVISASVVTRILALVAVLNLAAPVIIEQLPLDAQADAATLIARAAAWLTGLVTIIRRVTPVPASGLVVDTETLYRGLLRD